MSHPFIAYAKRLGYDEKLAQKAIQTRGKDADDNELLRVLISIVDSQKAMEYVKRNKPGSSSNKNKKRH